MKKYQQSRGLFFLVAVKKTQDELPFCQFIEKSEKTFQTVRDSVLQDFPKNHSAIMVIYFEICLHGK